MADARMPYIAIDGVILPPWNVVVPVTITVGRTDPTAQPDANAMSFQWRGDVLPSFLRRGATATVWTPGVANPDVWDDLWDDIWQGVASLNNPRFTGTVADISVSPDPANNVVIADVTCIGTLTHLADQIVGDEPWPLETDAARIQRVVDLTRLRYPVVNEGSPVMRLRRRDVDRRKVLELLHVFAGSVGSIVWEYPDGSVHYQRFDMRDVPPPGGGTYLAPTAIRSDVKWAQSSDQLIDRVRVEYGDDPTDGPRPEYIAGDGWYETKLSAEAADLGTAQIIGDTILDRWGRRDWWSAPEVVTGSTLLEPSTYEELLRVLPSDHLRTGNLTLTPSPGRAGEGVWFIEGWEETFDRAGTGAPLEHRFRFSVSDVRLFASVGEALDWYLTVSPTQWAMGTTYSTATLRLADNQHLPTNGQLHLYVDGYEVSPVLDLAAAIGPPDSTLDATNICINPSFEINGANWASGPDTVTSPVRFGSKAAVVPANIGVNHTRTFEGNVTVTFSGYVYIPSGTVGTITPRLGNSGVGNAVNGPPITARDRWVRSTMTATSIPEGGPIAFYPARGNTEGDVYIDGCLITLGDELLDYFDGNTPDTPEFQYEWTGEPDKSSSTRTSLATVVGVPSVSWDIPHDRFAPGPHTVQAFYSGYPGKYRPGASNDVPVEVTSAGAYRIAVNVPTVTPHAGDPLAIYAELFDAAGGVPQGEVVFYYNGGSGWVQFATVSASGERTVSTTWQVPTTEQASWAVTANLFLPEEAGGGTFSGNYVTITPLFQRFTEATLDLEAYGTYQEDGTLRPNLELQQGDWGDGAGDYRALLWFKDPEWDPDYSITGVEVFLYALEFQNGQGGTVRVGSHYNETADPETADALHNVHRIDVGSWPQRTGRWVDITGWGRAEVLHGGPFRLAIGPADSDAPTGQAILAAEGGGVTWDEARWSWDAAVGTWDEQTSTPRLHVSGSKWATLGG